MKIIKEYVGFQEEINVGRFAYILHLPETEYVKGVDIDDNYLLKKAVHFSRIVLMGESLLQKEQVASFLKKLKKKNNDVKIEIETRGRIKPLGLSSIDITYNVSLLMADSNVPFNDRVNINVISWFVESEANFKFYIHKEDDVDEVSLMIQRVGIPKKLVYLIPATNEIKSFVINQAKYIGYNWSPFGERFDINDD